MAGICGGNFAGEDVAGVGGSEMEATVCKPLLQHVGGLGGRAAECPGEAGGCSEAVVE